MSILNGKNLLIVGDENAQLKDLYHVLDDFEVHIDKVSCADATMDKVRELSPDLILLSNLKKEDSCKGLFTLLRSPDLPKVIPVFAFVEDSNNKIQEAISLGVTDYITPQDDTDSILLKIKTIFEENPNFSGSTTIDITPEEVSVTSTGIKVYVIEDDPLLRNLLSIRLTKSSFPSEFSSDGRQVVSFMRQFKPDVIILDLMLPGISGFEILKEVKASDDLKDVPVIVFSNRDGQDDRKLAKELGASAFYVKAMTDLSELIEKIEILAK